MGERKPLSATDLTVLERIEEGVDPWGRQGRQGAGAIVFSRAISSLSGRRFVLKDQGEHCLTKAGRAALALARGETDPWAVVDDE